MRKKITVVGAGRVGETTAHILAKKALGDIVLVDIVPNLAAGKALDLMELRPIDDSDITITGTSGFEETAGSDVVVVTSGMPRKPGESREDLLRKNIAIVKPVSEQVMKYSPNAFLVVVANPLDTMTWVAKKVTGWPKNRVVGMAGILDAARLRCFIAMELGVSVKDVQAFVLGGHGDEMVPCVRYASVGGIPIEKLMSKEKIDAIVKRTRGRRRRDRQAPRLLGLLLAGGGRGRDGPGDPEGREAGRPVLGLPRRRVRRERHLPRRPGPARGGRRREGPRGRPDRRGEGDARQLHQALLGVDRRGEGAALAVGSLLAALSPAATSPEALARGRPAGFSFSRPRVRQMWRAASLASILLRSRDSSPQPEAVSEESQEDDGPAVPGEDVCEVRDRAVEMVDARGHQARPALRRGAPRRKREAGWT